MSDQNCSDRDCHGFTVLDNDENSASTATAVNNGNIPGVKNENIPGVLNKKSLSEVMEHLCARMSRYETALLSKDDQITLLQTQLQSRDKEVCEVLCCFIFL